MTSKLPRVLGLLAATVLLTAAAMILLAVMAPPASAHSGPHDPISGTLTFSGGQDSNCNTKVPGNTNCPKFTVSNCHGATGKRDGWYSRQDTLGGAPVRGVLVIFSGGGGQHYWQSQANSGSAADQRVNQLITDLRNAGFVIFQVRWGVDWPKADAGDNDGLHVACKPARILKFLHNDKWVNEFHTPAHQEGTCGFCVMGTSGGSSAVAWMLTHFMAEGNVDAAFPTGGPPHGNMSKGCVPSGPSEVPYDYGSGSSIQQIDFPFQGAAKPCYNNTSSFKSTWDAHSIGSLASQNGADQIHPKTRVHLIDGSLDPLRYHGYDWMTEMWKAGSRYTGFQIVPGAGHSIYDSDAGMAALKTAILRTTTPPRACANGLDDDWDGKTDYSGGDPGCGNGSTDVSEKILGTAMQCDNAVDDDGDGFIDFRTEGGDGGCTSAADTTEAGGGGPALSINDVNVQEALAGESGTTAATFTVTLSESSMSPVTVGYRTTQDGTATPSDDYTPVTAGSVQFAPGDTSKQIYVQVKGDVLGEPTQTFNVLLESPAGATIDDGTGQASILDNEPKPDLTVSDVVVAEDAGSAVFDVTLTGPSDAPISVSAATADGTATAPSDYAQKSELVSWSAGETGARPVSVAVANDGADEADETFRLNLSSASGWVVISDAQGVATITDDDEPCAVPTISIADADPVSEGPAGTISPSVRFVVSLSAATTCDVTFQFDTSDVTAHAPGDYGGKHTSFTIFAGNGQRTVSVNVKGDDVDEDNETFNGSISQVTGATIADGLAEATIVDDDPATAVQSAAPVGRSSFGDRDLAAWFRQRFPVRPPV